MQIRILDTFLRVWNSDLLHSLLVRLAWTTKTAKAMRLLIIAVWLSNWDVPSINDCSGYLEPFLRENEDRALALRDGLVELFGNLNDLTELKFHLGGFTDGDARSCVTADFEADGPLVLGCCQNLTAFTQAVQMGFYPDCTTSR